MKIPNIIYMRFLNIGKGGSVRMYAYMNFRKTCEGVVYAANREAAKRKVKRVVLDAEFYR